MQLTDALQRIAATYIVAPKAMVARKKYVPGGTNQFTHGVTIAVGCGNRTLASFGAGSLTYEKQQLPDPDKTEYDLASVSKSLTAGAVLLLVQEGKMSLDDPVSKYLPEYLAVDKAEVTIRQLLEHKSGLHDPPYATVAYDDEKPDVVKQKILDYPLTYPPGTQYDYSNFGFDTLYWAASIAAGESLDTYIQANILTPLGMTNTAHFNTDSDPVVKNCAPASPDKRLNIVIRCLSQDKLARYDGNIAGHAGWRSDATSWGKYAQTIAESGVADNGQVLYTPATMQSMETHQPGLSYSLGTITNAKGYFSKLMSPEAVGHTGYNGPEWSGDSKSKLWLVMLANGTYRAGAPARKGFSAFSRLATALAQVNNTIK